MRRLAAVLLALVLAACTTIAKVDGEQIVGGKLAVTLPHAWNKVTDPWERGRYDMWTQEGIPLDHLRLWAGLRPGESLVARPTVLFRAPGEKDPRYPTFTAGLRPHRLVNLFEQLYANEGVVQVTRMEPAPFAGQAGVRFEFTLARRADDLVLQGVGWAAEHRGELYAATFAAPKLAFFPRLLPMAEAVVRSARIRG
ncbi:hypothetical protein RAMLITH_03515 [Ramlibacter sp. RBP-2]|uniref:Lipoprotein n=1 Tax=Ramlibacter lithotrophicus TaxID=2606681 RepID=A0A7X6DCZ1_9BURK|nr:hypothetical protein [Ramlibacter lithotrophicus]NKE64879.1 hypothetical protein [Ramlibacter lithotrophicus]